MTRTPAQLIRRMSHDRHHRLRHGQPAQRAEGLRAASACAAEVTRDAAAIERARRASCCPASARSAPAWTTCAAYGLVDVVRRVIERGTPFLGICLGMQLLFEESEEFGPVRGLGVLARALRALPRSRRSGLPHAAHGLEPDPQAADAGRAGAASTTARSSTSSTRTTSSRADPALIATVDRLRRRVRLGDRARQRLRLPVPSGEEPAHRPADPARTSAHCVGADARRRRRQRGLACSIIPAIDLKGGKCVRLLRGDMHAETVYGDDPVAMGRRWVDEGARYLHVVDLDGAVSGAPVNGEAIAALCAKLPIPIEVGGGVRTRRARRRAARPAAPIASSSAPRRWSSPDVVAEACRRFPGRVAVGIDARDGKVAVKGWLETSAVTAVDLARRRRRRSAPRASSTPTSSATARSRASTSPPRARWPRRSTSR